MNKKKAYTGMKTPVLMKVGNSAVLQVSANPGRNQAGCTFPRAMKSTYLLLL